MSFLPQLHSRRQEHQWNNRLRKGGKSPCALAVIKPVQEVFDSLVVIGQKVLLANQKQEINIFSFAQSVKARENYISNLTAAGSPSDPFFLPNVRMIVSASDTNRLASQFLNLEHAMAVKIELQTGRKLNKSARTH